MNTSSKVSICGIVSALSVMFMMLTGVVTIGTYAIPAIAGLLIIIPYLEVSPKWAWMVFIAVSILSVFLAADKEAAVIFVMFFGYYPIIKMKLDLIKNLVIRFLIKLIIFNSSVIVAFFISIKLLGIPEDSFTINGVYLPWAFLIAGNIIFLIYDYAITDVINMYTKKVHKHIVRTFR